MTLRVWHPSVDPEEVTRAVGIEPEVAARAGDSQADLGRRALTRVNRESYWCGSLLGNDHEFSRDDTVQDVLEFAVGRLRAHAPLFGRLGAEGGRVALEIGAHGRRECAMDMPCDLLQDLLGLNVDLSFHVTSAAR